MFTRESLARKSAFCLCRINSRTPILSAYITVLVAFFGFRTSAFRSPSSEFRCSDFRTPGFTYVRRVVSRFLDLGKGVQRKGDLKHLGEPRGALGKTREYWGVFS